MKEVLRAALGALRQLDLRVSIQHRERTRIQMTSNDAEGFRVSLERTPED